jgi:hypothetical protein
MCCGLAYRFELELKRYRGQMMAQKAAQAPAQE